MKFLSRFHFVQLSGNGGFSTTSSHLAPDKLFKKIDIELRYVI